MMVAVMGDEEERTVVGRKRAHSSSGDGGCGTSDWEQRSRSVEGAEGISLRCFIIFLHRPFVVYLWL
jgi:hypothetical protein